MEQITYAFCIYGRELSPVASCPHPVSDGVRACRFRVSCMFCAVDKRQCSLHGVGDGDGCIRCVGWERPEMRDVHSVSLASR